MLGAQKSQKVHPKFSLSGLMEVNLVQIPPSVISPEDSPVTKDTDRQLVSDLLRVSVCSKTMKQRQSKAQYQLKLSEIMLC